MVAAEELVLVVAVAGGGGGGIEEVGEFAAIVQLNRSTQTQLEQALLSRYYYLL